MMTETLRLPGSTLRTVGAALRAGRPAAESAALLRSIGTEIGTSVASELDGAGRADLAGIAAEAFWERLCDRLEASGWGRFELRGVHPGVSVLESSNCAETDPRLQLRHPGCHLTTGLIAAALDAAAGGEVALLEVSCQSAGDDLCRFAFGSSDTLGQIHDALSTGSSFEDAIRALDDQPA